MLKYCRAILVALSSIGVMAGCAGNNNLPASAGVATTGLSLSEVDAVTVAARTMVKNERAQVHGLKSRKEAGSGTHVCGYVRTASTAGTPIYVELRTKDAAIVAERGQVGATPENLAKVKFMCRNHGDW